MKQIDRYIIRQFLTTALFSLAAGSSFHRDRCLRETGRFYRQTGRRRYRALLPLFHPVIKLIIPVAMLRQPVYSPPALRAGRDRLQVERTSYQLLAPISSRSWERDFRYFNGWIVPATKKKFTIERVYLHKDIVNAPAPISTCRTVHADSFAGIDDTRNTSRVSIQDFSIVGPPRWWNA
jgi:hypothetical protein